MSQFSTIVFFLGLLIPYMVFASQCGPHARFDNCASPCDPSCKNPGNVPQSCAAVCQSRCRCISPYIRKGNQCVLRSQC
ncbi:PREDICTED: cysteine-rich venom protein 6-like [Polistes dominula]|uniref:Cysteine-rich venom protein 6-like n=1 Tax=Polistes dominula TaxID=743375 RepID=A0ABM1I6Q3_POLDO|nr:PREDICTED: cysteine-rich venom protein 6-like [Polistes dominula]